MDANFWINAWDDGRTNFHQPNFHPKLLQYFPALGAKANDRVLVPLCGKAKDLMWLKDQGLKVHGVELYLKPVTDFFSEHKLYPTQTKDQAFTHYTSDTLTLSCGDFFKLDADGNYDFVYDRASLVALPEDMRREYAKVITAALRPGGKCLLIVYTYDQSLLEGPPFNVTEKEIQNLYGSSFKIKLLEEKRPANEGARLDVLSTIMQKVYVLEKK